MSSSRKSRIERLEERFALTVDADIVFLMDQSGSSINTGSDRGFAQALDWLQTNISGIDSSLRQIGVDSLRYGLVGFGGAVVKDFGHSFLVDSEVSDPNQRLFSESSEPTASARAAEHVDEISASLNSFSVNTVTIATLEDGWDAIEHVVAEYNFRMGAVPIIVMLQSDEGRIAANSALTKEGVYAAMAAKNILLNVIVPGRAVADLNF